MQTLFQILHEDPSLLVVNKPAGLVCHPTKGDAYSSLISRLRLHLGPDSHPQLINRLDRETSGVVVVAKDPESARAWRRVWEAGGVTKSYLAIVHGHAPESGTIDAPLGRDKSSAVAIKDCVRSDGAPARTRFQLVRHLQLPQGAFSLIEIQPETGRKHQIRIHLAWRGHPLVGDKIYGPDERCYLDFVSGRQTEEQRILLISEFQCLHAQSVAAEIEGNGFSFACEPEPWFRRLTGVP